MLSCDLKEIFGIKRDNYSRSDRLSGNWTSDSVGVIEEAHYKKLMGFSRL